MFRLKPNLITSTLVRNMVDFNIRLKQIYLTNLEAW